ncbi:NAD(+) synthase [Absiella sp. AM29-15]|uniref:NAD(+) synthase n=1 Tax=Absiella sp. AM29-15 TaxID=2292278 RepID=UPI000E405BCA|nr:NAD(+) synthase [Absiella sp. AM29-15]RGC50204.1 NAD(+) synthase [Absiella sp. AM29-15]
MKIAIVTMMVKPKKCEENFVYMKQRIEEAKKAQADMIVFGQNAISGYLLSEDWMDDAWCRYVDSFNERLIAMSDDIAIVWGNIRYRNKRRFNAAFFAYQGNTHMRVKKNETTEYVDDAMYFEESDINSAIEFKDMVFALNFGKELQLADMNINLDAHPYDMDEESTYHGNIIYANVCGAQNSGKQVKVMEGGSYIYRNHELVYQAAYFTDTMDIVDIHDTKDTPKEKHILDALLMGIKSFDASVFPSSMPWVVGLSGGLDSSVTAALLTMALGNKRIYGYNMPTGYNSTKTIDNAEKEANALKIAYHKGSIQKMVDDMKDQFMESFGFDVNGMPSLVQENLQARIRGFVLNGISSMLGGVVVNNANMVEASLGYCTLYGDSIGALSLIGDLDKVTLFEIAHEINARMGKEVVPENLLPKFKDGKMIWDMMPSAELKDAQKDPMKWFYHDALLNKIRLGATKASLLLEYRKKTLQNELGEWMQYYHIDTEETFLQDLDWLLSTMKRNAFKRLQLPPCITLHAKTITGRISTQGGYGKDDEGMLKKIMKIS